MYNATSYHHSYEDTGLLCIHASADPRQVRAPLSPGDQASGHGAQLARLCFPLSCRFERWWKSSQESLS